MDFEKIENAYATVGGTHRKVSKIFETVDGVWKLRYDAPFLASLIDFVYTRNADGTVTLTGWKGTLNGVPSTELVIPNDARIIL